MLPTSPVAWSVTDPEVKRALQLAGKIAAAPGDCTYDIAYDDGEKETRVEAKLIRSKDGGGGGRDEEFREGDKVEARYRGREKYYAGKISRDRGDGTCFGGVATDNSSTGVDGFHI